MKKLIAGLALLSIIFVLGLANSLYLDIKVTEIENEIIRAAAITDNINAAKELNETMLKWQEIELFSDIFLRQSEKDAVSEAFYDCLSAFSEGDEDRTGAIEKLLYRLENISEMEKLSLASIF